MLNLPFDPTEQQLMVIAALARFVNGQPPGNAVFMLNGYAGTGKTSLVSALVKTMREIGAPTVLLAPTGRAAKVFSGMAGMPAYTIHRRIYRMPGPGSPSARVALNVNRLNGGIFIVDEASMIGDESGEMQGGLLEDLLEFVFSGDRSRLVFLGDTAQLPPVGCATSPALDVERLKRAGLRVSRALLTQVVRQSSMSGILANATLLRRTMSRCEGLLPVPKFRVGGYPDVIVVEGHELADTIATAYSRDGIENTLLITRSNRAAVAANSTIRAQVMYNEEELCRGERLLVAKNNYLWTRPGEGLDFIANGDVATVTAIHSTEVKDGRRFADVTLHLPHFDVELDCKIMLDVLTADTPALPPDDMNRLLYARMTDPMLFASDTPVNRRRAAMRTDPWLNALQVKYAYAVTCHKAQGGQWTNVMVDMSGLSLPAAADASESERREIMVTLYRWLYTAFTRATERLYLVNPPEDLIK